MIDEPEDVGPLLERARHGDGQALEDLFSRYRDRLLRMARLRLDRRLQARIDSSDIVQEAFLEAAKRLKAQLSLARTDEAGGATFSLIFPR